MKIKENYVRIRVSRVSGDKTNGGGGRGGDVSATAEEAPKWTRVTGHEWPWRYNIFISPRSLLEQVARQSPVDAGHN